jgi:hypothetical protein
MAYFNGDPSWAMEKGFQEPAAEHFAHAHAQSKLDLPPAAKLNGIGVPIARKECEMSYQARPSSLARRGGCRGKEAATHVLSFTSSGDKFAGGARSWPRIGFCRLLTLLSSNMPSHVNQSMMILFDPVAADSR